MHAKLRLKKAIFANTARDVNLFPLAGDVENGVVTERDAEKTRNRVQRDARAEYIGVLPEGENTTAPANELVDGVDFVWLIGLRGRFENEDIVARQFLGG